MQAQHKVDVCVCVCVCVYACLCVGGGDREGGCEDVCLCGVG